MQTERAKEALAENARLRTRITELEEALIAAQNPGVDMGKVRALRRAEHVTRFTAEDWSLIHPLSCRLFGPGEEFERLVECPVHKAVTAEVREWLNGLRPGLPLGDYFTRVDEQGRLEFERVSE